VQHISKKSVSTSGEKVALRRLPGTNIEQILTGRWRLASVSMDSSILCGVCGHAEQLVSRLAGFTAIRPFLLTLN
jgi:hypothetical protein